VEKMQTQEVDIFKYTEQKLKAHLQNNNVFSFELETLFSYYLSILLDKVKEGDRARLEKELNDSINGQVFNGYFIIQEALNNEEAQIADKWFEQPKGSLAQQVPDALRDLTGDNIDEIITNNPLKKLSSWLVVEYEDVYATLMDISLNTAAMGAKWAIYDEAEKRGIEHYSPQYKGMLAYLDDVTFLNPQNYISVGIMNEKAEVWEIIDSKFNELAKIGEVTVVEYAAEDNSVQYYMNVNIINDSVTPKQRQELVNSLVIQLMEKTSSEKEQLTVTVAIVEEFLIFK